MISLVLAIALSATPAERHAVFLKTRFDGSAAMLKRMRAEVEDLSEYWGRYAKLGRAQALVAWRKREELLNHLAGEILRAPVPPEIVRLGPEAVEAYKEALRNSAR